MSRSDILNEVATWVHEKGGHGILQQCRGRHIPLNTPRHKMLAITVLFAKNRERKLQMAVGTISWR